MNEKPLAGRCIVTTRPAAQADGLASVLQGLGATVLNFPVITIASADPEPLRELPLETCALAFFVSPNAVDRALQIRPRADWPATLRVAAVGPASAHALEAHGFSKVLCPHDRFDSEGVLALPEFSQQAVAGKRILIVRGEGGRELLADSLAGRGAKVLTVSCYRRICATLDPLPLEADFHAGKLSALVFSASQGLTFFLEIMGQAGLQMLCELPTFAPHPRICGALRSAGATRVVLTPGGDAGIAEGIAQALKN